MRKYKLTKKQLIGKIYNAQRHTSIRKGWTLPNYTQKELESFILSQKNFLKLYYTWVASNYERFLIPSCDRLNDYKPYTLDNLRLVTWKENFKKANSDQRNGINNKTNKAIYQIDKYGNIIKEYYSMGQAGRELKIDRNAISNVCRMKRTNVQGYRFKFK